MASRSRIMAKVFLMVGGGIGLVLGTVWFMGSHQTARMSSLNQPDANKITAAPRANTAFQEKSPNDSSTRTQLNPIWTQIDPRIVQILPLIRNNVDHAQLFQLDFEQIQKVTAGDWLSMPIPGKTRTINVLVDSIEESKFGTRSIHGHVQGHKVLGFVLTSSSKAVFATIGTFDGVFNLMGNPEYAWIVKASELNKHVDPNIPDFQIPVSILEARP